MVFLFGSVSRGAATSDSDVDLLILEADVTNPRKEGVRIRNALRGLGVPFDVIVMRSSWFERTKDVVGSLAYPVHREGKVIYAA
jgi:predicted nucleotidyltransferase